MTTETVTCYRPVGPAELNLVASSEFKHWPPRLPEQPIFYLVTNERYATELTKWNVDDFGTGYVLRFSVEKSFMDRYEVRCVGAQHQTEWWVPAEVLELLNSHIVGSIEIISEFSRD